MDNTIIVQNIQEYTQQMLNGNLVLTRIVPIVDEVTLFQQNLKGSTILECKINNVNNNIKKYKKLLVYLYSITDVETILQNSILNISQRAVYEKGFEYYADLGISIQGADARRTLKEIINVVKIKNCRIDLKIKLKNDEVIRFVV